MSGACQTLTRQHNERHPQQARPQAPRRYQREGRPGASHWRAATLTYPRDCRGSSDSQRGQTPGDLARSPGRLPRQRPTPSVARSSRSCGRRRGLGGAGEHRGEGEGGRRTGGLGGGVAACGGGEGGEGRAGGGLSMHHPGKSYPLNFEVSGQFFPHPDNKCNCKAGCYFETPLQLRAFNREISGPSGEVLTITGK